MRQLLVRSFESIVRLSLLTTLENNIALQEQLYQLRSETQEAFDRAKSLEARWKELEKEQREVYQVRLSSGCSYRSRRWG